MPRTIRDGDVIPLNDVADVSRNWSVGSDSVFLHLRYQIRFSKESWRRRPTFYDAGWLDVNDVANLVYWDLFVSVTLPRHNIQKAWVLKHLTLDLELLFSSNK